MIPHTVTKSIAELKEENARLREALKEVVQALDNPIQYDLGKSKREKYRSLITKSECH